MTGTKLARFGTNDVGMSVAAPLGALVMGGGVGRGDTVGYGRPVTRSCAVSKS
jgi:hypothetical protein